MQDRIPNNRTGGLLAVDAMEEQTAFVSTTYIQESPERVWQGSSPILR